MGAAEAGPAAVPPEPRSSRPDGPCLAKPGEQPGAGAQDAGAQPSEGQLLTRSVTLGSGSHLETGLAAHLGVRAPALGFPEPSTGRSAGRPLPPALPRGPASGRSCVRANCPPRAGEEPPRVAPLGWKEEAEEEVAARAGAVTAGLKPGGGKRLPRAQAGRPRNPTVSSSRGRRGAVAAR